MYIKRGLILIVFLIFIQISLAEDKCPVPSQENVPIAKQKLIDICNNDKLKIKDCNTLLDSLPQEWQLFKNSFGDLNEQQCTPDCSTIKKAGKKVIDILGIKPCCVCMDDYSLQQKDDCWNQDALCKDGKCVKFEDMGWSQEVLENVKKLTLINILKRDEGRDKFWYNKNWPERSEAAKMLGKIGSLENFPEAAPVLLKILESDPVSFVKEQVITSLLKIVDTDKVVPSLLLRLEIGSQLEKSTIILRFGEFKLKQTVPVLLTILESDSDNDLRFLAASSLGSIGSQEAVPTLLKTLETDQDAYLRMQVIFALGVIGSPEAVPVLINAFESIPPTDDPLPAAVSLQKIGSKEALFALTNGLKYGPENEDSTKKEIRRDKRSAAVNALGEINSLEAVPDSMVPALIKVMESDPILPIRAAAIASLQKIVLLNDITSNNIVYNQLLSFLKEKAPLLKDYSEEERGNLAALLLQIFTNLKSSDKANLDYTPRYFINFLTVFASSDSIVTSMKEIPLFKIIYSNKKLKSYTATQKYSISISVYRYILKNGEEATDLEINNIIDLVLNKRKSFEDKIILGGNTYFILFSHADPIMKPTRIKSFAIDRDIKKFPQVESLIGDSSKENIIKFIKNSKEYDETLIWANAHGLPHYICLQGGETSGNIDINKRICNGFRYDEFADILLERGNLNEVILIIDSCFSYDFAEKLIQYLREKNSIDFPTIITTTNKQQPIFIGAFINSLNSLNIKPNEPLFGRNIYEVEEYLSAYQDLAVFFSEAGKEEPLEIAMNTLNPSQCESCTGDSCPLPS